MIKKSIYPKTKRIPITGQEVSITEKLDGSNLCFYKQDGELYIAERNFIYSLSEAPTEAKYKDLKPWLEEHGEDLKTQLYEGSVVCGEWLGMGNIKYDTKVFPKKFYMFAKANLDEKGYIKNPYYHRDFFIYPFNNQEIPEYIGLVPVVSKITTTPDKETLDVIYDLYSDKVKRPVEGFVIALTPNTVNKYVRMKRGKVIEYSDTEHKGDN